jgi:hypothetical protein
VEKLDRNLALQDTLVSYKGGFGYQLKLADLKGRKIEKGNQFDIFVFANSTVGGTYKIQNMKGSGWEPIGMWENSYYKNKQEIFPTVDCKLWDIVTKCPRLSTELVKREYVFFLPLS